MRNSTGTYDVHMRKWFGLDLVLMFASCFGCWNDHGALLERSPQGTSSELAAPRDHPSRSRKDGVGEVGRPEESRIGDAC